MRQENVEVLTTNNRQMQQRPAHHNYDMGAKRLVHDQHPHLTQMVANRTGS